MFGLLAALTLTIVAESSDATEVSDLSTFSGGLLVMCTKDSDNNDKPTCIITNSILPNGIDDESALKRKEYFDLSLMFIPLSHWIDPGMQLNAYRFLLNEGGFNAKCSVTSRSQAVYELDDKQCDSDSNEELLYGSAVSSDIIDGSFSSEAQAQLENLFLHKIPVSSDFNGYKLQVAIEKLFNSPYIDNEFNVYTFNETSYAGSGTMISPYITSDFKSYFEKAGIKYQSDGTALSEKTDGAYEYATSKLTKITRGYGKGNVVITDWEGYSKRLIKIIGVLAAFMCVFLITTLIFVCLWRKTRNSSTDDNSFDDNHDRKHEEV